MFACVPRFVERLLPGMTFSGPGNERTVYLSFDDGPTPGLTEWVLDELARFDALATFFCLGRNADKNRDLYQLILERGHSVGNHTYSHLKGFSTSTAHYLADIELASQQVQSSLFRPPYGRIRHAQARRLRKQYELILWNVLSADYNTRLHPERVLKNVVSNIRPGSIIVFHDSLKAEKNLRYALPATLDYLEKEGYSMRAMPMEGFSPV